MLLLEGLCFSGASVRRGSEFPMGAIGGMGVGLGLLALLRARQSVTFVQPQPLRGSKL